MEKISHIVRGNARVASVDLKNSPAVRPGVPSYGRPVGESPAPPSETRVSTAMKASALQHDLEEHRKANDGKAVAALADQFFMSRIRRPAEEPESATPIHHAATPIRHEEESGGEISAAATSADDEVTAPPSGYKPRGSYIDVRA